MVCEEQPTIKQRTKFFCLLDYELDYELKED